MIADGEATHVAGGRAYEMRIALPAGRTNRCSEQHSQAGPRVCRFAATTARHEGSARTF